MIDINKEWDFITCEVCNHEPKITPFVGNDFLSRELLFMLQIFLSNYSKDSSVFNFTIYQSSKKQYLKLISEKNDHQ